MFMRKTNTSGVEVRIHRALAAIARGVTQLCIGDDTLFSQGNLAHGGRRLSAQRKALSLNACGGALQRCGACDGDTNGRWDSVLQCDELELATN